MIYLVNYFRDAIFSKWILNVNNNKIKHDFIITNGALVKAYFIRPERWSVGAFFGLKGDSARCRIVPRVGTARTLYGTEVVAQVPVP